MLDETSYEPIIGALIPESTFIGVLEQKDKWIRVQYRNVLGWVSLEESKTQSVAYHPTHPGCTGGYIVAEVLSIHLFFAGVEKHMFYELMQPTVTILASPSHLANPLCTLERTEFVEVLLVQGEWLRIRHPGVEAAWLRSKNLKPMSESECRDCCMNQANCAATMQVGSTYAARMQSPVGQFLSIPLYIHLRCIVL